MSTGWVSCTKSPLPLRSPEGVSSLWVSNAPSTRGHSMIRCRDWALPPYMTRWVRMVGVMTNLMA